MCILSESESNLLRGIARRSKMDCWFCITIDGKCKDLENKGKIMNTSKAVKQLLEGMSFDDFTYLTDSEKYQLINLLLKC